MGHTVKGQSPRRYKPSATRRASGLSPVKEVNESFIKTWNALLKHLAGGGRSSPKKSPVRKGRFLVY